jgi:hypothetical protein
VVVRFQARVRSNVKPSSGRVLEIYVCKILTLQNAK